MINKICYLIIGVIAIVVTPSLFGHSFLYNSSESIPKGLYWGSEFKNESLNINDIACFRYSAPEWAKDRQYFPDNFTLCKKVLGQPSDLIIQTSLGYSVIHSDKSTSLVLRESKADSKGRQVISAKIKGVVPNDAYLLIGTSSVKSMDSRFLGFIPKNRVTMTAVPLITFKYFNN